MTTTTTTPAFAAAKDWNICGKEPTFILAGQSNMAGRCNTDDLPVRYLSSAPSSDNTKLVQNTYGGVKFEMFWENDGNFDQEGSSNGKWCNLQSQPSPGLNMNCFGPEIAIASTLGPRLSAASNGSIKRARFIKFAMGSTNLHSNWNPKNTKKDGKPTEIGYYQRFIQFCKDAIEQIQADDNIDRNNNQHEEELDTSSRTKVPTPMGLFWLQGESDSAKARDANAYLSNFQQFAQAVRNDLDCPELFIVVSPVVWHGKKVKVINQALQEAGNGAVENCICIDELDVSAFGVQGDDAGFCAKHLTAEGVLDVGERMGEFFPL